VTLSFARSESSSRVYLQAEAREGERRQEMQGAPVLASMGYLVTTLVEVNTDCRELNEDKA